MEDQREKKKGKNVLVGVTGSVAAIKVPEIVKKLIEHEDPKVNLPRGASGVL